MAGEIEIPSIAHFKCSYIIRGGHRGLERAFAFVGRGTIYIIIYIGSQVRAEPGTRTRAIRRSATKIKLNKDGLITSKRVRETFLTGQVCWFQIPPIKALISLSLTFSPLLCVLLCVLCRK